MRRKQLSFLVKRVIVAGLVIWVFFVSGFYYFYHQLEVKRGLLALSNWLLDILLLAVVVTLSALWGHKVSHLLKVRFHSPLESVAFSAGLGYAIVATVILYLGLGGWLHQWTLWLLVGLLSLGSYREARTLAVKIKERLAELEGQLSLRLDFRALLLLLLGVNLFLAAILASCPPTEWDALAIHLVIPKVALAEGGLAPPETMPDLFTQKPLLEHMLFTLGMGLRGDRLAQQINFSFLLLIAMAIYSFSLRYSGPNTGFLAATIFVSVPLAFFISTVAYVDLGVTFYTFLATYALINWLQTKERSWLIFSAVFGALAPQVKNNGLFVLIFLVLGLAYGLLYHQKRWRERASTLSLFLVVMLLTLAPWLTGTIILSGKPSPAWSQLETKVASAPSPLAESSHFVRYLLMPWEMTVIGIFGNVSYAGTITPLFLLLLPLWFTIRGKGEAIRTLMVFSLVEFVLWVANPIGPYPQSRLAMPFLPALSIITAYLLERSSSLNLPSFSLHRFLRLVTTLVLGLHLMVQMDMVALYDPWPFLLGQESRHQYLTRILDQGISSYYYSAISYINEQLPPTVRVGIVWPERRIYYCERICVSSPFQADDTAEEMMVKVRDRGLTHLLVSKKGQEFILDADFTIAENIPPRDRFVENLKTLLKEHFWLVHNEADSFLLYALEDS